jgi:hypothetical protein
MNDAAGLAAIVAALSEPGFYPQRPARVEVVQTHISYVFIAGEDVYKLKKPVRFAFLDFSTLEKRRHFCDEEIRLNRRLAGDTYLGVLAICQRGRGFEFLAADAAGAVEYAVHMRRLPGDRILTHLLERDQVDDDLIDCIVAHRRSTLPPMRGRRSAAAAIRRSLPSCSKTTSARSTRSMATPSMRPTMMPSVASAAISSTATTPTCAAAKPKVGSATVTATCTPSTSAVPIRWSYSTASSSTPASGIATSRRRSHFSPWISSFTTVAISPTGWCNGTRSSPAMTAEPTGALLRLTNARIREKVDSPEGARPEVGESGARRRTSAVARFSPRYTWAYTPRLVVVAASAAVKSCSPPLAGRTGSPTSPDATRAPARTGRDGATGPGATRPSQRRDVSGDVRCGPRRVAAGRGAIIDATFQRRAHRDAARAVARQAGVQVRFVECVCPVDEVRRRLEKRRIADSDASDADREVYQRQLANYEAFAPNEDAEHVVIDTTAPLAAQVARAESALRHL